MNVLKQLPFIGFLLLISACKPVNEASSSNMSNVQISQCIDSQSQCEVSTELANFSIKFSQHQLSTQVKTELPFVIKLTKLPKTKTLLNLDQNIKQNTEQLITKISAYLEGKDMFMGKVPVFFQQTDKNDVYTAESLLASCSEDLMIWRLWITVEMANKSQTFFVDFTSQRL
jgi:hypothetical protein